MVTSMLRITRDITKRSKDFPVTPVSCMMLYERISYGV